jgi:hypothetical protein
MAETDPKFEASNPPVIRPKAVLTKSKAKLTSCRKGSRKVGKTLAAILAI